MSMTKKNILVVDDEPKIREVLFSLLESKGYGVYTAENGKEALAIFEKNNISLVLLDLMLPDISGEEVCALIRKKSRVPILMLTAKSEESSFINGLSIGADHYITKPFSLKALAAQIEAILRRSEDDLIPLTMKNSWREGDLVVDFNKNQVIKKGVELNLTPSEHKILSALVKYPGKVFSREELMTLVFDNESDSFDRVIDNHIKNLRQKIEDDSKNPVYILTIRGLGYRFGGD